MATDFLVKQGKVMGGVRLVTDADVAHQTDLTNIRETGTTASQAISAGTYFYLNGTLVKAKVDIANGATFTLNTNYEVVTAGALNELNTAINNSVTTDSLTVSSVNHEVSKTYTKLPKVIIVSSMAPSDKNFVTGVIYINGADSAISNVVTIYFEGGSTATILANVTMSSKTLTLTLRNVVFDDAQIRFVEFY